MQSFVHGCPKSPTILLICLVLWCICSHVWCCGVFVLTSEHLRSTESKVRFCQGLNHVKDILEVCNAWNLRPSGMEIRLSILLLVNRFTKTIYH